MRTHTCSWSHRQTNKRGWGCVEKGWGRTEWNGERSFSPAGCSQTPLTKKKKEKLSASHSKSSTMSAQAVEREAPCPLQAGGGEKGWLNLKRTSERLSVSWTAEWRNHLPRGCCWTDRRTEWGWRIHYSNSIMCAMFTTHHGSQHMQPTTTFDRVFRTVFVHSAEGASSPVSCTHSAPTCVSASCVCLCELIALAAEALSNATLQILPMRSPLKPERLSNSAWNWRSWIWSAPPSGGAQTAPEPHSAVKRTPWRGEPPLV